MGSYKGNSIKERVIGRVGWLFILSDVWANNTKTALPSAYTFYT
jgi:hypothetical protein